MKRKAVILSFLLFFIFTVSILYYRRGDEKVTSITDRISPETGRYARIISLSPGITETLFAFGLGERVAGVTRFCRFPPEAREKADVGGFVDPNYEAIAALQPDLVLLLAVHEDVVKYLDELDMNFVTVRNEHVSDILESITTIGNVCGVEDRACELVDSISGRMEALREKTRGAVKPRVLISIGRFAGAGSLDEVYAAGRNTFYNELIEHAGGVNAYSGYGISYPVLSAEGLLALNPEIIVDLVPGLEKRGLAEDDIKKEWDAVSGVDAVKNGRVFVVGSDYAVIPGPRFIIFLEDLAAFIHPEITGEAM